ncbi:hypothetical protein MRBLRH13_000262 [Agrobacterium radiobacter]|uniref:hypothetical protein n=1 Tax=Agrobacterium radiobacter TaxID=362 RepID=UPI00341FA31F
MKLGVFENGFPKGFYDPDVHGENIPSGAVEITDEQWLELVDNQGMRQFLKGRVVEYMPPEEPVPPPQITKRQLRLALVRNGISLASVEAAIASMPDGLAKEEARIEWEDASFFRRDHPTLLLIASALGLGEEQIDTMWMEAADI